MNNDIKIYNQLRKTTFSYTCEAQGILMLQAIENYLLSNNSMSHSLLRLALRPLFYTGYYNNLNDIIYLIENTLTHDDFYKIKHPNELISWLKDNSKLIETIFKELNILNDYYEEEFFDKLIELNISSDEVYRVLLEEEDINSLL